MRDKKRIIIFIIIDIIMVALVCIVSIYCMNLEDDMRLNVYFGESHAGKSNIAQLFYAGDAKSFSGNNVLTEVFEDNVVTFDISGIDFDKNIVRFDPFNRKRDFTIAKFELVVGEHVIFSVEGKQIETYIDKAKGVKCKSSDAGLECKSKKDNPRFIMSTDFSARIYKYYFLFSKALYIVLGIIVLALGIIQIKMLSSGNKKGLLPLFVCIELLMAVCAGFIYALYYIEGHFGQVPFGQLIYHLHTPLQGTDVSSFSSAIILGVVVVIGVIILNTLIYIVLRRHHSHYGYVLWAGMMSTALIFCSVYRGISHFEVVEYYRYTHESTTLYDEYYADGRELSLKFPEKKRNLIYIFLESMELSYADVASGGGMQDNLIPNLTKLGLDNECFSDGNTLNGAYHVSGATYTMGALTAQTSGVSINEAIVSDETLNGTWDSENNYLPGVWAIGDVLKQQGYNQEFLIGSKGEFAGRSSYFKGHGDYVIEDYTAVKNKGRIPSDYKVWWGYEDEKLFQFAKEDLIKLSESGEPFNLTMLTVDTHFTDGYVCDLCDNTYDLQYSNVITCSDRQVKEFIEWLESQDFYDNTTIVICGDHLTPDSLYANSQGLSEFDRRTYTVIINPADGKRYSGPKRTYTTFDLYPTTLSAMGVEIEGNRLGLGVDLYSDKPTIAEERGLEYLNTELMKNSDYYTKKLLYK